MKQTVYLETTIPSYLTAWRSNELIMAANQQATREWWDLAKPNFEVFISEVVIKEAAEGNEHILEERYGERTRQRLVANPHETGNGHARDQEFS